MMQVATKPKPKDNQKVTKFVKGVEIGNRKTAIEYKKRLGIFGDFVLKNHDLSIDELIITLTTPSHGPKIDVYDLLSEFAAYLIKERNVKPSTVKSYLSTVRTFLETVSDIEISPRKYKQRVKMPRVIETDETEREALHKKDVQTILNACHYIRLKTYVLFLAATGSRAQEALSIRLADINFDSDPVKFKIRGKYTKTKKDRVRFMTKELTQYLQQWIEFKHRTRKITRYDKDTGYNKNKNKTNTEKRTPKINNEELLFSVRDKQTDTLEGIYNNLLTMFEGVLDRLGGKYAEFEDSTKKRRKFTLHSFRRFVKTTISDLGYNEYSEWYIGHKGSSYYNAPLESKIDLFKKIEPNLTFLDQSALERKGADQQTRIEYLEQENYGLKSEVSQIQEALTEWRKVKEHLGLT